MKGEKRVAAAMLVYRIGEYRGALRSLRKVKVVLPSSKFLIRREGGVLGLCFVIWR